VIRLHEAIKGFSQGVTGKAVLWGDLGVFIGIISQP
jgi:hypothetical protein